MRRARGRRRASDAAGPRDQGRRLGTRVSVPQPVPPGRRGDLGAGVRAQARSGGRLADAQDERPQGPARRAVRLAARRRPCAALRRPTSSSPISRGSRISSPRPTGCPSSRSTTSRWSTAACTRRACWRGSGAITSRRAPSSAPSCRAPTTTSSRRSSGLRRASRVPHSCRRSYATRCSRPHPSRGAPARLRPHQRDGRGGLEDLGRAHPHLRRP